MELSFIRCSSCRSLVPASAKTCRMCGAPIGEEVEPKSKTVGSIESDENAKKLFQKARSSSTEMSTGLDFSNPLSGFLKEESDLDENGDDLKEIDDGYDLQEDEEEFLDDGFDDEMFHDSPSDGESENRESGEELSFPGEDLDFPDFDEELEYEDDESIRTDSQTSRQWKSEQSSLDEADFVNSSPSSRPLSQDLKAGSAKTGGTALQASDVEPKSREDTEHSKSRVAQHQKSQSGKAAWVETEKLVSQHTKPTRSQKSQPVKENIEEREHESGTEIDTTTLGALRGWLVMLEDGGQSVELRTGKLLLTSSHIRDQNELVIEDPSVSVPHAMLHVGDSRIRVFDLVSEQGTSIERNGKLERVENFADLNDRDYLILGNVRLLVVLI